MYVPDKCISDRKMYPLSEKAGEAFIDKDLPGSRTIRLFYLLYCGTLSS